MGTFIITNIGFRRMRTIQTQREGNHYAAFNDVTTHLHGLLALLELKRFMGTHRTWSVTAWHQL